MEEKKLLSLVMIVKDEAASIRKVLDTVKPFVDYWTILDTGSTDGTQEIIRDALADLPGDLREEPFVDFAASRNRVMELNAASGMCEFQLMLSGDEYLRGGEELRSHLATCEPGRDCHFIRVLLDASTFFSPRIFRSGSPWTYVGELHEYPTHPDANAPVGTVDGAVIDHIVADPEKRLATIWEVHIPHLEAKLEKSPCDERSLIFLAQSYESLLAGFGDGERVTYAMKAMSLYLRRLAIPTGNEVERNYCKMQYLDTARLTGVYTDAELYARAEELRKTDPHRPEVALLCAELSVKVLPLTRVYELAREAAEVAFNATKMTNSSPVSLKCGWQAHHLAAVAAKQLAAAYPSANLGNGTTYEILMRDHIAAGLAMNGPKHLFRIIDGSEFVESSGPEITASL